MNENKLSNINSNLQFTKYIHYVLFFYPSAAVKIKLSGTNLFDQIYTFFKQYSPKETLAVIFAVI